MSRKSKTVRTPRAATNKRSPLPQPKGRRERRAAQTRAKLYRCALRLIGRRGLGSVTVEDITEAADVGKGTFFNYFESKEHLVAEMAEIQLGKLSEAATLAGQKRLPIRTVLQRMMLRLAEEPGRNARIAEAFLASYHADRQVRATILLRMKEVRRVISGVVMLGQRRGEIDRKLRKEVVAAYLFQSFMGTLHVWSVEERPALRTALTRAFEQFWRSIAAPRRARRR